MLITDSSWMINLIPREEKKKMIADFYYRLAILVVVTLSFCVLVALLSMLPSYFISSIKNSAISAKIEAQKLEPSPISEEESSALVKDTNNKLALIEKFEKNKFYLSIQVINAIILKKRPDIKVTQILYENDGADGRKISIAGMAPSREVLLLFRRTLEGDAAFTNVILPISNFVKGSNISFFMSLTSSQ